MRTDANRAARRGKDERAMWMSEPGAAPDVRDEQPALEKRVGRDDQWGRDGAPPAVPNSAQKDTQPRVATPPPRRATPPQAQDASAGSPLDTRKRKRVTDSAWMPALRLGRRERKPLVEQKPRMVYDTERAPGYLRLARLGAALASLAAAWGVALLVASLAQALWMVAPRQPILTERFALYLLDAVGILWLAVVAMAMILVGAFSLFLALTRRAW